MQVCLRQQIQAQAKLDGLHIQNIVGALPVDGEPDDRPHKIKFMVMLAKSPQDPQQSADLVLASWNDQSTWRSRISQGGMIYETDAMSSIATLAPTGLTTESVQNVDLAACTDRFKP